jgi:tetratricopeptide (TPR) repeat protein
LRVEEGLAVIPNDVRLLAAMGRIEAGEGKSKEAAQWLTRAVAADPNSASAHADLGDIRLQLLRQPAEAEASYRAAIKLAPDSTRPRIGLALSLAASSKFKEAIQELEVAATMDKTSPAIPYLLGRVRAQSGNLAGAYDDFSAALARQSDFEPALRDRADAAAELRRDLLAIADYERILKKSPGDAQTMVKLGVLYDRNGRDKEATRTYEAALKINPSFALAYNNLAWTAAKDGGDLDKALAWAKRAVELSPQVPQFQDTLGWVHRRRGESSQALAAFQRATQLQPPLAEAFYHLGLVYRDAGKAEEAKAAFRRALEISKDFSGADEARKAISR